MDEEEKLIHYGVLGMRWGIRRSQEQLGRRTDGEKTGTEKADGEKTGTEKADGEKNQNRAREKEADAKKKERLSDAKNRHVLTEAEISSRIARLKMEREFNSLVQEDIAPGKKFVTDVLKDSGKRVATTVATGAMLYAVKAAVSKELNMKELSEYLAPKPKNK